MRLLVFSCRTEIGYYEWRHSLSIYPCCENLQGENKMASGVRHFVLLQIYKRWIELLFKWQ